MVRLLPDCPRYRFDYLVASIKRTTSLTREGVVFVVHKGFLCETSVKR